MKRRLVLPFLSAIAALAIGPVPLAQGGGGIPPCERTDHAVTKAQCDLKGPVRTAETWLSLPTMVSLPTSSSPNPSSSYTFLAFDKDGHLTAKRTRVNTGLRSDVTFTASSDGRTLTIEVHWVGPSDPDEHQTVTVITFDAEGHEIKSEIWADDMAFSTTEHAYDGAGRVVSEATCPGTCSGSFGRTEYSYDAEGRLIKEAYQSHPNGAPSPWSLAYEYPAANVVRELYFGGVFIPRDPDAPDSVPTRITETTKDGDGRPIQIVTTMPGAQKGSWGCTCRMPGRINIRYDKEGRVVDQTEYSPDGLLQKEDLYVYDADGHTSSETHKMRNGNELSETHEMRNGENETKQRYEFDEHGNWIRKEIYRDNPDGSRTVWSIENRTVTYYQ